MSYPGGKNGPGTYQTLINLIPPHEYFASIFGGHCAIMQQKRPAARNVLIDLDPGPLDWWAQAWAATSGDKGSADAKLGGELRRCELYRTCGVAWLRHQFGLDRWPPAAADAKNGGPVRGAESGGPAGVRWFIYCDPPYPLATRSSGPMYRNELTDRDHARLLRTVKLLAPPEAAVMISTYPNRLYCVELGGAGWHRVEFESMTRAGKRTEVVYMNYPPPAVLHDYRFLGSEKREREKIRRRCRNWVEGLERMPEKERAAVLQAIRDRQSPD